MEALSVDYSKIPEELKSLKQWGLFKLIWKPERNKYTKIPHNAIDGGAGRTNDPSNWTDFETALKAKNDLGFDGLGFYFANGYVGIDIDHVEGEIQRYFDGDNKDNIVNDFVTKTKSYTEYSVSKTGLHIIIKGELPGSRRRKGDIEMYQSGRFFAMTGNRFNDVSTVNTPSKEDVKFLYDKYIGDQKVIKLNTSVPVDNDLSIDEIIHQAESSNTGKRFTAFMNGGWESSYTSQSEADLAFANDLAFWAGRDFHKMDEIYRSSDLMRPKWDEKRGKTTYGIATLNKAINETHDVYHAKKPKLEYHLDFLKTDEQKKKEQIPPRSWDDTGNAERFLDHYGDYIKYSYTEKAWYVYNGSYWEQDTSGKIHSMLDKVIDNIKNEKIPIADSLDDKAKEKMLKEFQKFIKSSRSNSRKKAIIDETQHHVPVMPEQFDREQMLLNSINGYIDLSSGELHDPDKAKMFSKTTGVEFTDKIDCPEWITFLNQIFDNNQELINYIQKAVGYSLTGSTKEQIMFVLYGNGRNGKSIFLDTLEYVLGNYAMAMQASSIMVKQNNGGPNSDIARLKGARLVTSSEPNEGTRLDEGLVKQLTGGDTVTARMMYGSEFEFTPQFKIWLATNHKPIIRGTDEGIWRRLILIPFNVQIPDNQVDKDLKYKLQREGVGILNWAVDGCLKWQANGLKKPQIIKDSVSEYRDEMDVITAFTNSCCELGEDYTVQSSVLYQAYKNWANVNSQYLMSSTKFGVEMRQKYKRKRNKKGNVYIGLRLIQNKNLNFLKDM